MSSGTEDQWALAALPVFFGLSATELAEVSQLATVLDVPTGEAIFSEGEPAEALYAILRGNVDIRCRDRSGQAQTLATLEAGAILGEISLLTNKPHAATAVAVGNTTILRLAKEALLALLEQGQGPARHILYNLARGIASRLGEVNRHLMRLLANRNLMEVTPPEGELDELKRTLFTKWTF